MVVAIEVKRQERCSRRTTGRKLRKANFNSEQRHLLHTVNYTDTSVSTDFSP